MPSFRQYDPIIVVLKLNNLQVPLTQPGLGARPRVGPWWPERIINLFVPLT
jgi:hypothetical protein